jgi:hypothetical protein
VHVSPLQSGHWQTPQAQPAAFVALAAVQQLLTVAAAAGWQAQLPQPQASQVQNSQSQPADRQAKQLHAAVVEPP